MSIVRTITSSDAKAKLGEVLGSLAAQGPIEITRNGRLVGVLAPPAMRPKATDPGRLAAMAALYSAGAVTWRAIADETGAAFGELLLELARQGLPLPTVVAPKRPEQAALLDEVMAKAAAAALALALAT